MDIWYIAVNGQQQGPFSASHIIQGLRSGIFTSGNHVWRQGFPQWLTIDQVPELQNASQTNAPPIFSAGQADVIDYEIHGTEMQFVEIGLDPGESVVAEAGSMMYMAEHVQMETIFGDGSHSSSNNSFFEKMLGAGKRLITGESLFTTIFTYSGSEKGKVAFAAPYPGKIIPLELKSFNSKIVCQKSAFLCAAKGVSIGVEFQKKIGTALFGGEGFIMQKLEGDGLIFVHAGGTIIERELHQGQILRVDTGCLVALTQTVDFDIEYVGGVKSALFGGEGFFFASLRGPGHVWLQSLPFSRLAGRIHEAAPQNNAGFSTTGEGSMLGGLGNIFNR